MFGVDNPQSSQIRAMVSETDSVLRAAGFDDIHRLESKLVSLICVQAEPGSYMSILRFLTKCMEIGEPLA